MRNLIIISVLALIFTGLVSFKISTRQTTAVKAPVLQNDSKFVVPDNIKLILDKSCLPCHGADGKTKAKMKWNYDKTFEMDQTKMISKLSKIVSKVEKDKMPTAKFNKKYPDRKLTPEEKQTLISWADGLAENLTE